MTNSALILGKGKPLQYLARLLGCIIDARAHSLLEHDDDFAQLPRRHTANALARHVRPHVRRLRHRHAQLHYQPQLPLRDDLRSHKQPRRARRSHRVSYGGVRRRPVLRQERKELFCSQSTQE